MAYKVLYRKYRPKTFADVVGQDVVTKTLQNEIMSGRIAHAYLFTGSRGTGKTTCAKILAKAVNCLNPINGDPCGECENCVSIDKGTTLDVMEIDAASNNKVDHIRSLIEEVAFTPASAKYRVYIIDEAHELTDAAFNALLKTLEEPPEHVIFILATTETHKLLTTILSRCQRFDFRRITTDDIANRLEYICSVENATIDRDAALMIGRIADGGMRDAISILDQCMGKNTHIDCKIVEETSGVVSKDSLFALCQAVINKDSSLALKTINSLHQESKDLSHLCEELIDHFRNLMLIRSIGVQTELIKLGENEIEKLSEQAENFNLSTILHCLDTLQSSLDKMKYSNQRIELEMAFIKLCSAELDGSYESLIRRIEALEQRKPVVAQNTSAIMPNTGSAQETRNAPPAPNNSKSIEMSKNAVIFKEWKEVVHSIKEYSMSIGTAFDRSNAYINGDYVLIEGSKLAFNYLRSKPEFKDRIKESIYNLTGKMCNLGPYINPKDVADETNPLTAIEKKAEEAGIEIINK